MISEQDKVYIGYWGGDRIWRQKTAEERLAEFQIKEVPAKIFMALNEKFVRNNQLLDNKQEF